MRSSTALRLALSSALVGGATVVLTPATAQAASLTATLVANHSTSTGGWATKPAPDPAGITWDAARGRLVLSDSEVDEMPLYKGTNIYYSSLKGAPAGGWTTEPWSYEPTGISFVRSNFALISDDDKDKIFLVTTNSSGTPTATPPGFTTRPVNGDAEDVDTDMTNNGHILVIDGVNTDVYEYSPGPNGRFDGVKSSSNPKGDDTRVVYDVGRYGAKDPEGIKFYPAHNSILVLDSGSKAVYELNRTGGLLNKISIAAASPKSAAGITLAPASNGSGKTNLYICDRGVDNNTNPSENDGRFYEMSVPGW